MLFCFFLVWDSNKERGRENVSFSVVEELKPRGFRERSDVRFPTLGAGKNEVVQSLIFMPRWDAGTLWYNLNIKN